MKSLIFDGPGSLRFGHWEEPVIKRGQVLIDVAACGICGADMHVYGGMPAPWPLPGIWGHEFSGRVIAWAEDVPGFRPGDPVVVQPLVTCGQCRFRRSGRSNVCTAAQLIGGELPGGYAERVVAPAPSLFRAPESLGPKRAALAETLAASVHAFQGGLSGILGEPAIEPAISRNAVAAAAGTSLDELLASGDKSRAISAMARGVAAIASGLHAEGKLDAVIALGGVQGTVIGTAAMRALPVGVPKVMVSTVANGQATFGPFVGTKDIAIMHSVADILGLNIITRQVLAEAAGAAVGMAEMALGAQTSERPTVAMTMAGVTIACVMRARERFEGWGYEVIAFHCNGIGAEAVEELADAGQLQRILDLSPHDIGGYLRGGLMQASPDRLHAVSRRNAPIVFVPGGLDFILFGPLESIPPAILERQFVIHNPIHTQVRADHAEMREAGRFVAERLSQASRPATVTIPRRGYSQLNIQELPLYAPEADQGFVEGLRAARSGKLVIEELDMHINEPAFADAVTNALRALIEAPNV